MWLQIPPEMIKEIAEQLDCGMKCFYNTKTVELEYYPDEFIDSSYYSEGPWKDVMDKIDENPDDYLEFIGWDSHESFRVMENFINQMSNQKIQAKFEEVIRRRKPFQQFKYQLYDFPDLREQWFAFKEQSLIDYVTEQLEAYNFGKEAEEPND